LVVLSRTAPAEPPPDPATLWVPAMSVATLGQGFLRDYRVWATLVVLAVAATVMLFA
jgi:hypothetical protein